jgi:hypothetical protein
VSKQLAIKAKDVRCRANIITTDSLLQLSADDGKTQKKSVSCLHSHGWYQAEDIIFLGIILHNKHFSFLQKDVHRNQMNHQQQ